MEGRGTYRYATGNEYVGEFKAGQKEGRGTYRYASGDEYDGEYREDKKEGRGTYRYASGFVEVGFYKANADVGEGVRWSADRTVAVRLRDGQPVEAISLEEAEATCARLGLPAP